MKPLLFLFAPLALSVFSTDTLAAGDGAFARIETGVAKDDLCCFKAHLPAYSLRSGYFFNDNFGVEAFYTRLDQASDDFLTLEGKKLGLGVIGKKSFGGEPHTGAFISGRIGYARTTIDASLKNVELDADSGRFSDSASHVYAGIGAGYDFNQNLGLSLNFDTSARHFSEPRLKVDQIYTLGFEYRF